MDAASRIKTARRLASLTQAELARRAATTQPAVAAYESGRRIPTDETLLRLLVAAGFRPSRALAAHRDEIVELARRHKGGMVRVFGSVARGSDTAGSDIDLLVHFDDGTSLMDVAGLHLAVQDLLGIPVDVVDDGGLKLPKHQRILDDAVPV